MDKVNLEKRLTNGTFGDSATERKTFQIPLHILLTFPVFWKASKIIDFAVKAWDIIKTEKDGDPLPLATLEFVEHLKNESKKALSPSQPTDWSQTLGEHYDILKNRQGKSSNKHDTQHVHQLLRLLRNNYVHPGNRKNEKKTLGWFKKVDEDKDKLSDSLFIEYFNRKFPKLVLFLWWKFYEFKNALQQFYSDSYSLDHYDFNNFHWENESIIPDLINQLYNSLSHHTEEGNLVERFVVSEAATEVSEYLLEFRTLETKTLSKLGENSDCVSVIINNNGIHLKWIDSNEITEESNYFITLDAIPTYTTDVKIEIHLSNSSHVNLKDNDSLPKRYIFLLDDSKCSEEIDRSIQKIYSRFIKLDQVEYCRNSRVCWNEVRRIHAEIRENSKISIQKYQDSDNRIMKLQELLPSNFEEQDSILSRLNGKSLNILLKRNILNLFEKYKIPKFSPKTKYLERRVSNTIQMSSKVLRHRFLDVFLVSGIKLDELKSGKHLNPEDKNKLQQFSIFGDPENSSESSNSRIYVVADNDVLHETLISKFMQRYGIQNRNIHLIKYIGEDLFEWIISHRYGPIEEFQSFLQTVAISENDFLTELVENAEKQISPVFIMDKPGMGKSCLLISLSNKILERCDHSFIILKHMNEFVQQVKMPNKESIVNAIVSILCNIMETEADSAYDSESEEESPGERKENCDFEKSILSYWLLQTSSANFKFELMLDSLDEVDPGDKELASKILNIIKSELPSVRFWVTSREYTQDEIEKMFNFFAYKIEPFSEKDQTTFLKNCWQKEIKHSPRTHYEKKLDKIVAHYVKQASTNILAAEFAGAPLQCGIIAEIYKEDVISAIRSGKLENSENKSLTSMYSKMIDRKLVIYLEEKCSTPKVKTTVLNALKKDMLHWHMYYAIKLFFPRSKLLDSFATHLGVTEENLPQIKVTVGEEGIVENLDPPRFIHRTFGEYFLALFIYNVLSGEIGHVKEKELNIFVNSITRDALEFSKGNNKHDSVSNFAVTILNFKLYPLTYFLNELCDSEICNKNTKALQSLVAKIHDFDSCDIYDTGRSVILALMRNNQFNFARILLEAGSETKNRFFTKSTTFHGLFIDVLIRHASVDFLRYVCSMLETWYEEKHKEIFTISLEHFKLALKKGKYEIVKFLVEEKGFDRNKWDALANSNSNKYGVIHYVIEQGRKDTESVFENRKQLLSYLVELDHSIIELKDKKGRTPILLTPINTVLSLKMFMVNDLGANVNAVCKFKYSVLHWKDYGNYANAISPNQYHEMLEFFVLHKDFKLINSVNRDGWTPLMCAIRTYYDALSVKTLELFEKAGADFNIKRKDSTVLDMCRRKKCKQEFIDKLIECGAQSEADYAEIEE